MTGRNPGTGTFIPHFYGICKKETEKNREIYFGHQESSGKLPAQGLAKGGVAWYNKPSIL